MTYYAHMRETEDGKIIKQTVQSHIVGCAQRAAECLSAVGLADTGYLAGLLHDMGKYTKEFQSYLSSGDRQKRGSVIHTFQGCRYIMEKYHRDGSAQKTIIASELIAFAIGSHHGLFDCVDSGRRLGLKYRCDKNNVPYKEAISSFLDEIPSSEIDRLFAASAEETDRIVECLDKTYDKNDEDYAFETGLLARLILSAVIEGDRRDTAAFMNSSTPPAQPDDMTRIWKERLAFLEKKLADFPCVTNVAKARHTISETCREFADRAPGIYRLNVPTGGGKTLSSLRYALAHAEHYNKKRLIFVSPLLSILEQNARVIRDFVGDDSLILEHHSNAVQTEDTQNELDRRELLAESWDSPIIITTLVQLLNTMFDGRTTSVRRFQALCGSVIVIDEVQTVPLKLLTLFNLAIEFLSGQCGATVVLCSATQPELEGAEHPLRNRPQEIVPPNDEMFRAFRRTKLQVMPGRRLDELPELIMSIAEEADSLLVVCNKKAEAAYLSENTVLPDHKIFHLSAAMCMQDMGNEIFVKSNDRCDDGFKSLSERAAAAVGGIKDKDEYAKLACEKWLDVRSFGQVFAFKSKGKNKDEEGVSVGVRGPVSIHQAVSISPVEIESMQITKSVNGDSDDKKASDTMGTKHFVRFGLYEIKGAINVQLAEKTGFTHEDAETVKECLRTLFVNDASSARPEGSMEVVKLYWWEHNCRDGQYSSAKVHRSVHVTARDTSALPESVDDYNISHDELSGLEPEIIDGI